MQKISKVIRKLTEISNLIIKNQKKFRGLTQNTKIVFW